MARHSFIQMSKLPNVKGRISYITSHARQENLYATYRTADNEFWSNLARESQQEFKRSGTEGKCIEARELIIALPEIYTRYEPQEVLEDFTEEFRRRYGVECVSALHHNKRKTNYHIHLIFSERKLLPEPDIKIATRSVFYDETGKRVPGVTRIKVVSQGDPADADQYQDIIDEIWSPRDSSQLPCLNVGYTQSYGVISAVTMQGGYSWTYTDEEGVSQTITADSSKVTMWSDLPIMNIEKATDMELYFDEQPVEVTAIAYPADFLGTEASGEEGETASIETDEDGNFVLKNAREGMIYLIRGQWENG